MQNDGQALVSWRSETDVMIGVYLGPYLVSTLERQPT